MARERRRTGLRESSLTPLFGTQVKKHIMNLVIALVLASAPALAFSPYDVTVTDGPTVAPT